MTHHALKRLPEEHAGTSFAVAILFAMATSAVATAQTSTITITHGLSPQNGYARTTSPTVNLEVTSSIPSTESVLVSGLAATWSSVSSSWAATDVALLPGINRVVVQSMDSGGKELDRSSVDIWYDRGAVNTQAGGTLPADATWTAAEGPYRITADLTVPAGRTLTIEPGATVYLNANTHFIVSGRLVAQGTPYRRIRFTRFPGSGSAGNWGGYQFNGARQPNVLAYADLEYCDTSGQVIYIKGSQVLIERITILNSNTKAFDVWEPQVIIRNSVFGDVGSHYMATIEHMLTDGWFIVDGNLFGYTTGDTDIFHLNHVSVKGGQVAQILNNLFTGAGDDIIDDNETDTHIEGNYFMQPDIAHPPRSAAAAITSGPGGSSTTPPEVDNLKTQHLTVVRNVFYKNDYAILCKTGAYVAAYNNVFVENRGAILFDEPWRSDASPGRAAYVESCIFWNNMPESDADGSGTFVYLTNDLPDGHTQLTVNNSLLPAVFHGYGTGNIDGDPGFVHPVLGSVRASAAAPRFSTGFDGFDSTAYILAAGGIADMRLQPGSPCIGTGLNGVDMGAYVPTTASISGVPASPTALTEATITVAGLDICGYKYRVVGPGSDGLWSQEIQQVKVVTQITRSGSTATATTAQPHGYSNGDLIQVIGAAREAYNGLFAITALTGSTFSYTVAGTPPDLLAPQDLSCRKPEAIHLTSLADGTYTVQVIRKNSINVWQSEDSATTGSWTVVTGPRPAIASVSPAQARPGEDVTVSGSGFHAGIDVFFRGTPSPLVAFDEDADPGTVIARVPAVAAGPAPVTVKNTDSAPSEPADFTVLAVPKFIRGDANLDGLVNISDAVAILLHLFNSLTVDCLEALDADDITGLNITDAIFLLEYLFQGGGAPPAPFPTPDVDPDGAHSQGCDTGLPGG